MVTNSFGNRNFIHPMGRLSKHSKCLDLFFLLRFGLGGGENFFSFSLCSQHVPFKFPVGSHQVPNVFPKGCSQQHLALIPYVLPKVFPFSPIQLGHRRKQLDFNRTFDFWGALIVSIFFVMDQSNWLIAKKKKSWTFEAPRTN